jgi:hypothetical protein
MANIIISFIEVSTNFTVTAWINPDPATRTDPSTPVRFLYSISQALAFIYLYPAYHGDPHDSKVLHAKFHRPIEYIIFSVFEFSSLKDDSQFECDVRDE